MLVKCDIIKTHKSLPKGVIKITRENWTVGVAIVDDNDAIHQDVKRIFNNDKKFKNIKFILESFYSSEEFLESRYSEVSVVILDIELPGMNGVKLSEFLLKTNPQIKIVFLTSYEHYMKDAFGLNVHSYLFKENIEQELAPVMLDLLNTLKHLQKEKLSFITDAGQIRLSEDKIICVLFEERKPIIYTENMRIVVYRETLNAVYDRLSPDLFVKANSGSIINVSYIKHIGESVVTMKKLNKSITISRGNRKKIQEAYTEFFLSGELL